MNQPTIRSEPTERLIAQLREARQEIAYLRLLVWKLSVADLARQDDKYIRWLGQLHVQEMPR